MWLFRLCLPIMVLLLAGCSGFSGFLVVSNGRLLLSVTVNPSFADPVNFPGAQVRFTATGNFNAAPAARHSARSGIPVMPSSARTGWRNAVRASSELCRFSPQLRPIQACPFQAPIG